MRMWMVDPRVMCREHLLGEHYELHMLKGSIEKGKKLTGFVMGGLVEVDQIHFRHEELVEEMKRRGYKHKSEMDDFLVGGMPIKGLIDKKKSKEILLSRCEECRKRDELSNLIGG